MTIQDILDTLTARLEGGEDPETEVFIEAPDETFRIAGVSDSLVSLYDEEPKQVPIFVVSTEE